MRCWRRPILIKPPNVFTFADQLTQAEIDEAEQAAAEWRAENKVKDYDDFFAEVNSPFREVSPAP